MHRSIDKKKIYFYLILLTVLLSIHNQNFNYSIYNFFKIKKIELSDNIEEKLNSQIYEKLNRFYNFNIFFLKSEEVENILDNFNILGDYKVKKEYPSSLKIDLSKTNIIAYYFSNDQKIYIGENGKKITQFDINYKNLPSIEGKINIKKLFNLRMKLKKHGFELNDFIKFYLNKSDRWDLLYNDNLLIRLPLNDIESSIVILKDIIKSNDINNINIIDLRIKNKIILSNAKR